MLLNRLDPYLKNNYKKNKGVRYLIKGAIESTGKLPDDVIDSILCQ
jgi:hypothetical protein